MIYRLSQKLAKKIKVEPTIHAPLADNPFLDWTAHIFSAARTQYIMVTNTPSLLSMICYGKEVTDDNLFILRTLSMMKEYLSDDPFTFFFHRIISPHTNRVLFSKSSDRRVIGSMNELIDNAKTHLAEQGLSPFETAQRINSMPMSYLENNTPERSFIRLHL